MFQVYHSNQLDLLKSLSLNIIKNYPLKNHLDSEIIVVQNLKISQWLKIEFSQSFNIVANIKFKTPELFLWELFIKIIPDIPRKNIFTIFNIKLCLMNIIPEIFKNNFIVLKDFLSDDYGNIDQKKLIKFSTNIAELFYKYLLYRFDWIKSWEKNEYVDGLSSDQNWQLLLWKEIIKYLRKNNIILNSLCNIYSKFTKKLNKINSIKINFPKRIFIFGINNLQPIFINLLKYIEKHTEVHLFLMNPCRHYWNDLYDNYSFTNKSINNFIKININSKLKKEEINNPLLASWGRLGGEYLDILNQIDILHQDIYAFVDIEEDNMIHSLQHDILNLQDNSFLPIHYPECKKSYLKKELNILDNSISINVCYSIYQEVAALHNYILKIMEDNIKIKPNDILVMIPNINNYLPFIQSIFINTTHSNRIPFSIIEATKNNLNPVIIIFLKLLKLPQIKCSINILLKFLEEPTIAEHFFIDNNGLIFLTNFIIKSNIFEEYMYDEIEPSIKSDSYYSWNSNLIEDYLQNIILNYKNKKKHIELLGFLVNFLKKLEKWQIKLSKPKIINQWKDIHIELINDFFNKDNRNYNNVKLLIEEKWNQVIYQISKINFKNKISINLIYEELYNIFYNESNNNNNFLVGRVNFCSLISMCSIPFKVICLLGMNDNEFPRNDNLNSNFDLTKYKTRKGDFKNNINDKYLFLETILAAQNYLYISYIGKDNIYNTMLYPSLLITELIDYIIYSFYLPCDVNLNLEDSAKNVYNHIHHFHTEMLFKVENFSKNNLNIYNSFNFNKECLQFPINNNQQKPFIQPLSLIKNKTINLKDFLNFWRNPIRAWFNKRLGIDFYIQSENISDTEPFLIQEYKLYQINNSILKALIKKHNTYKLYLYNKNSKNIPYGFFGELFWQSQVNEMQKIALLVNSKISLRTKMKFSLNCDNSILKGKLSGVQNDGILRWSPNVLKINDGLLLWIEHMIYCSCGGIGKSVIYGNKKSFWKFLPIKKEIASIELSKFIKGYINGLIYPLLFINKISNAWLDVIFDKKNKNLNKDFIIKKKDFFNLSKNLYNYSNLKREDQDLYLFYYFKNTLDKNNINIIIDSIEKWYLPMLIANQYKN